MATIESVEQLSENRFVNLFNVKGRKRTGRGPIR